jgi:hypothetical protein
VHVDDESVASVCASYPGGVPQYISGGLVTNELRKRRKRRIEQRAISSLTSLSVLHLLLHKTYHGN